jgi:hypothetical protein
MAGDWIKMRTDLYRDPKVCVMADLLMDPKGALSRDVSRDMMCDMAVTRNVTRNAVVGALVSVWGVLRHRGKRLADDLVIKNATTAVIDDIADLPGFSEAMTSVGWVVETKEGFVFPRFFEDFNVDPADEIKAKAAARQRRHRAEKSSSATDNMSRDCHVTVTPKCHIEESRVEESREEIKTKRKSAAHFVAPTVEEVKAYSREADLKLDADKFVDFYTSKDWKVGRNAMKDWKAAARNASREGWCKVGGGKNGEMSAEEYKADLARRAKRSIDYATGGGSGG